MTIRATAAALAALLATGAYAQTPPPATTPPVTSPPAAQQPSTPAAPGTATPNTPGAMPSTPGTATQRPSGASTFLSAPMSGQMMASRLMDLNLYAADGANLGDIDDLVLDRNGTVTAVVVGVGGFLGIGEKAVAIPFSSIRIEPQANDRDRLVVSATRDELRNAPEFRMSDARRSGADRRTAPTTTTPGAPGTTTPPTTPQR